MKALSYFEWNERQTQKSVPVDVVEWPDITVTEAAIDEDTLLHLDLMRNPENIVGNWYDPEEVR